MIFLTVGTYPLPFERLVKAIDTAIKERLIEEEVFAQVGRCSYKPQNMEYVQMLEKGILLFNNSGKIHRGIGFQFVSAYVAGVSCRSGYSPYISGGAVFFCPVIDGGTAR